jgi:hypothetical protein
LNPEKNKLGIENGILNPEKINWESKMGYWTQKKQIGHQRWDIEPRKNELGIKDGTLNPRKLIASKVNNLEVLLLQKGCQEHYYLLFQLYTVLHYCMSRSQKSSTTHDRFEGAF